MAWYLLRPMLTLGLELCFELYFKVLSKLKNLGCLFLFGSTSKRAIKTIREIAIVLTLTKFFVSTE